MILNLNGSCFKRLRKWWFNTRKCSVQKLTFSPEKWSGNKYISKLTSLLQLQLPHNTEKLSFYPNPQVSLILMILQVKALKYLTTLTVLPPGLSCSPSVCKSIEIGIPTFLDLPATTTFFPNVWIPSKKTQNKTEHKILFCYFEINPFFSMPNI